MRRILLLIILIFFIFYAEIPVWAQNVVIQVYDPQGLVLKSNGLLPMNFPGLEKDLSQPIQKELEDYSVFLLYRLGPVLTTPGQVETRESANADSNREVFKLFYNKPRVDEKAVLRQEWAEAFGFDVWSPYYKYKEIEKLVKKKLSVQIFKLKGEPRLEKGEIFYVFAAAF
ncbi:MAG: hypothetical protein NTY14_02825 [Candidatus Omnitrophica bacterium]|nr:hypothetical protein [Candidatus Omnitrophota bacterium]